nr:hypothetical protein [Tanacetum cinerariifolium]
METRTSTELKKILEIMEADKRDVVQQMKVMQDQIQELIISTNQRTNGDSSSFGDSVNKKGYGSRYSNDIKVDIPEYDGKLDLNEFVEWLRTVELVFDYKQTTEENKVKIVALKLRKYASTWWSNVCLKRERLGKEKIRTLPKMKPNMKQKFLPSYYIQLLTVESEEEVVGLDVGELLVVRRALNSVLVREEKLQREAIFHMRCTVAQKICSMIIDEGSCTNVASQTMVSKLNLPTESHPSPYIIHWLNQGEGIPYPTEFYCHSVLVNRIQIRFGVMSSLWMLVIPPPISPTTPPLKPTPSLSTLLKSKQHEFHPAREFILLGLDEEEGKPQPATHPLVQPLLKSYQHVFPLKIPSGLPPMRCIQQKIDLVPCSALPNKPAYRTNPHETNEIRKQVYGLLEKGLIRESLSPCVVPTLLVPKKNKEWRMCMDSRSINKITIKYRFPIPRLNDLFDELNDATVFSKVDLRSWYHQIRIHEGDE